MCTSRVGTILPLLCWIVPLWNIENWRHLHYTALCISLPTEGSHFCLVLLGQWPWCADYPNQLEATEIHYYLLLTMTRFCLKQLQRRAFPERQRNFHPTAKKHSFVYQRWHRFLHREHHGILGYNQSVQHQINRGKHFVGLYDFFSVANSFEVFSWFRWREEGYHLITFVIPE